MCADPREDVWGATDMGPRLPLDSAKSLGREMYLDRSRQFASIMQRLDELERLGVCARESTGWGWTAWHLCFFLRITKQEPCRVPHAGDLRTNLDAAFPDTHSD